MKERQPPLPTPRSVDRELAELESEATNAVTEERETIRTGIRRVLDELREREIAHDLLQQLPEFWHTIYGQQTGFVALFSGSRQGRRLVHPHQEYYPWPDSVEQAAALLAREMVAERELYQAAHLLTRPKRRKAYAAPLATLYVDLDHAVLDPRVPPPSVVVASSPERLQCYWRLNKPVPPAEGEALNRQLAHALGADLSGWDLTQLLRVPGTRNHKYPDAPLVRVARLTGRDYAVTELRDALPAEVVEPPSSVHPETRPHGFADGREGGSHAVQLTDHALAIWRGEDVKRTLDGRVDRSASLLRIARVLRGIGTARDEIVAALEERDQTLGWHKYTDRTDASVQYERIADLVARHRGQSVRMKS